MNELTTAKARELQERALNAQGARDQAREALYRADGSNRYGDEEHAERHGEIAEQFRTTIATVEEDAEREAVAATGQLATLEHGDPTALLGADELQRAGAKRVFVDADVEGLPSRDLADRLGAVLSGGDKGSVFCYLQATERRVRASLETAPAGVSEVLEEMRVHLLGDSRRRQVAETRRRVEEAHEVKGLVWALRRGGTNAGEVHQKQAYGDVAERLAGSSATRR